MKQVRLLFLFCNGVQRMIELKNISRTYGKGEKAVTAIKEVNITINDGEIFGIIGLSGAGKSTLLKGILGLIPLRGGSVGFSDGLKRTDIGYLPQQTQAQRDFPATVREVVLSGFANKRGLHFFYSAAEKSAALMNMGKLGVLELQNRCYRELSGGQQQRVLLARALCAADRLLILDEPVTGLDPAATQDLYKTLRYLNEKEKMAVIMVTHDMRGALREAHTILHIGRDGWFFGTVAEYLASPAGKRFGGAL